jgi:hypothetical protein
MKRLGILRQNNQQRTVASQVPRSKFFRLLPLGKPKGNVYKNNPCSIKALQAEITCVIGSIAMDELQKVSHNLFMPFEAYLQAEGVTFSTCYKAQ